MGPIEASLLGLVQGLTEFLPVSSSGHLVILQRGLGATQKGIAFEVGVHLATLGSVVIFYRRRLLELLRGVLARSPEALHYVAKLGLATLPAIAAVLLVGDFLEAQFESARSAAAGLLVTGAILWTTRSTLPQARRPEPGYAAALAIGCAQALAILPGISRSGATVATALALGVAPAAAAEFSFLMSVVAIAGAALRTAPELVSAPPEHLAALGIGGGVALVSGVAAIWLFVRLLRTRGFYRFAYYTWAVGLAVLVLSRLE